MANEYRNLGIVLFFLILFGLAWTICSVPEGFLEAGHCNETNPNSEVCWCTEEEERVVINETFVCVPKVEDG